MNIDRHPGRSVLFGVAMAIALSIALVAGFALTTRTRSADDAVEAIDDDLVVATLQTAGRNYSDELRKNLRAVRADPDDAEAAKAAARRLIAEGRVAGDSRLVGAALGVLRPFLGTPDADVYHLAATARQYQHDFDGALDFVDKAIALAPDDPNALLTRATINVVLGRFDAADGDCRRLHALPRPDLGFLCQSSALTLTAHAPTIYERLEEIVARTGVLHPALRGFAVGLMGEIAALQGRRDQARDHFSEVLAEDPNELRVRVMLADVLLAENDAAEALRLLEGAPEVDPVLLRRVVAAERLGKSEVAKPVKAELARRFRQNLDLGLTAHAREETRFYLEIEPDPDLALSRALVNWDLQHEIEDAQLLIDAAVLADKPEAAAPVLRWMDEQGVSVPTLRVPDAVREAAK